MRKNRKLLPRVAAAVTVLLLLNLFTFVLAADAILQVCDTTPTAEVSFAPGVEEKPVAQTLAPTLPDRETTPPTPVDEPVNGKGGMTVTDPDKTWGQETEIEIFHARYDETGEITVDSSNGDSLIAPGTGDEYYFIIRNTGDVPLKYEMRAEARVSFSSGEQELVVPLEAKFSDHEGAYLVGSQDSWEHVTALDGVTDKGGLSANHYAKYTLQWQWPFEGDDIHDTLLGNMAAAGDEISVRIAFFVTGTADESGSGGIPQTGDVRDAALWTGLCVCSAFCMLLLLMPRRKEEEHA